jgi:hypothetical protein
MSLATAEDARIDSGMAGTLLVGVFSFALGIFISLTLVEHAIPLAQRPCTAPCERLILMSLGSAAAADVDAGSCDADSPAAFDARRDDTLL